MVVGSSGTFLGHAMGVDVACNHTWAGGGGGSDGKASAYNAGEPVRSLGREDPLEKEMATHSSTLAWKILWTEDVVGYNPWGRKESDMTDFTSLSLYPNTK